MAKACPNLRDLPLEITSGPAELSLNVSTIGTPCRRHIVNDSAPTMNSLEPKVTIFARSPTLKALFAAPLSNWRFPLGYLSSRSLRAPRGI